MFGPLPYGPGDYLVLPIGTTWRLEPDAGHPQRILYLEAPSEIEPPKRYRNDYGQLVEHAPYSQRDLHAPEEAEPRGEEGDFVIHVRSTDRSLNLFAGVRSRCLAEPAHRRVAAGPW